MKSLRSGPIRVVSRKLDALYRSLAVATACLVSATPPTGAQTGEGDASYYRYYGYVPTRPPRIRRPKRDSTPGDLLKGTPVASW